ncbi:MAG: TonB-dependent receptor [Acidobacteriaceae bacterium]|nr:TonB-dependent receptor [Acidobacteriaceae bacterium]
MRKSLCLLVFLLTGLPFAALLSNAQTIFASLTGLVTDPSGAPVPKAEVRVVNTATNAQTVVHTRDDGTFLAPSLKPGGYTVTVSAQGFKSAVRGDVHLDVSQTARLDIHLDLGSVTETIDVTAQAPLLDTTTSSLGQVIDSKSITNLPLNERNSYSLVLLAPGVTGGPALNYNGVNISANGGRPGSNDVLLDGAPSAPPGGTPINVFSIFPSVDALQEFRVQTSNYSPEFGRSGGAIINMIYKSGTNDLHGSIYDFLRNSIFDANGFFANANGTPLSSFKRNQFGFSLGGPVVIPKLYNGHNKTFFFADYEGLRQATPSNLQDTVPTLLERTGDFSQTFAPSGAKVIIYDPTTTVKQGNGYVRAPFAGNVIPANRIDPVARNVMKYYPLPNGTGDPITHANNYFSPGGQARNIDQYDVKVDENIDDKSRAFVRVSRRDYSIPAPTNQFPSNIAIAAGGQNQDQIGTGAAADYTRNFSPTYLMEIRYGLGRALAVLLPLSYGFDPTTLGFPSYIRDNADVLAFPQFKPANYLNIGNGGPDYRHSAYETHSLLISNDKITNSHDFKFGFEGRLLRVNNGEAQAFVGSYSFSPQLTQGPDPTKATAIGGNSIASFLLGLGSGTMTKNSKIADTESYYYAGYFGDDWKITPKLTLNLGVRYEVQVPRTERHNRMNYFDPNVPSPLAGPAHIPNLKGGIVFVGTDDVGRRQFPIRWGNIAPRLGFAYQLTPKTILRGGSGLFYAGAPTVAGGVIGNFGYRTDTPFVGSQDGLTPYSYLSNPFPTGLVPPTGSSQGLLTGIGTAIQEPLHDATVPYIEEWSMDIQRELPGSIVVDAAYVGNHSVNLITAAEGNINLNQLTPQQLALGNALLTNVKNPFFGLITSGPLAAATVPYYYLLRQYPQFTSVGLLYPQGGNSFYNAGQLRVEKRFSNGLNFLLSYSKQKLIDDNSIIENAGRNAAHQNIYDRRSDRSVSANDVSQRFVFSAVYQLPVGRGQKFGASWNRYADAVLGGWQINGILTLQTGFPLNITAPQNGAISIGNESLRPNNNGHSAKLGGSTENRLREYFNTSVFSQPGPFTFGNTGRTLPDVRRPGIHNVDFSMFKNFQLKERLNLQLRGEAFNATNTVQFGLPNTTYNSAQFGQITTQANSARQLQFGLKLLF